MHAPLIPPAVLECYPRYRHGDVTPLAGGLINDTFLVTGDGERCVFQRLHPIFEGAVNDDIDAITRHLSARGLCTPHLIRTAAGEAFVTHEERPWRALTYVDGTSHARLQSADMAREAGALVARFHRALADLSHTYAFSRGNVHDTPRHLRVLEEALRDHAGHPLYPDVRALAQPLLEEAAGLPDLSHLMPRHCHGDLKVSNLLFDREGRGLCLVDLDTLSRMIWPYEMGDALRSWCNPGGEDEGEVRFDLELFEAAITGYASEAEGSVGPDEREATVVGIRLIALELAARFLADALREQYFGYDATRFATRGAHNLLRGRGQWALYRSVTSQQAAAEAVVARAFAGRGS